ncbi:hypothetical protein [Spiroplasma endosymbiont of Dilophus febrilis]|uniref:hypothetical protein n=1 Tax=Spiroplasma endosymbiont of Dilophus febrilis TaxID=3066292 RepID=UPI00313BBCF4
MKVLLSIASIMSLTAPTLPVPTSNIETVINNDIKPLGEEIIISNKEELLHNVSTIAVDSVNNNIYFGTYHGAYVIDQKTNKAKLLCKDALNVNEYRHIRVVAIDSNKNIYFGTFSNGAYVLKVGATTATKIEGVSSVVRSIAITSNDDVYFGTKNNTYILKANEATVNKFSSLTDLFSIAIDSSNNIYYSKYEAGAYVLKVGATTATKIDGVDDAVRAIAINSNNDVYFGTVAGIEVLKSGETTVRKINGINGAINAISFDNNNNMYYSVEKRIFKLLLDAKIIAKPHIKTVPFNLQPYKIINSKNVSTIEGTVIKNDIVQKIKTQLENKFPGITEKNDYYINTDNLNDSNWTVNRNIIVQATNNSKYIFGSHIESIPILEQPKLNNGPQSSTIKKLIEEKNKIGTKIIIIIAFSLVATSLIFWYLLYYFVIKPIKKNKK